MNFCAKKRAQFKICVNSTDLRRMNSYSQETQRKNWRGRATKGFYTRNLEIQSQRKKKQPGRHHDKKAKTQK